MSVNKWLVLTAVLLVAAPLSPSQTPQPGDPLVVGGSVNWFEMTESEFDVARLMGPPKSVADFGVGMVSLGYALDDKIEEQEFSHQFVFHKASHRLISVVRNYAPEIPVEALFPATASSAHYLTVNDKRIFGVRLRRLSGGRLLLAMGAPVPGQTTSQLLMMRESDIGTIYPWLSEQLGSGSKKN